LGSKATQHCGGNLSESQWKKIIQISYNPRTSSTRIKEIAIAQSDPDKYIEQAVALRPEMPLLSPDWFFDFMNIDAGCFAANDYQHAIN
jgi:hypothetical protein